MGFFDTQLPEGLHNAFADCKPLSDESLGDIIFKESFEKLGLYKFAIAQQRNGKRYVKKWYDNFFAQYPWYVRLALWINGNRHKNIILEEDK